MTRIFCLNDAFGILQMEVSQEEVQQLQQKRAETKKQER